MQPANQKFIYLFFVSMAILLGATFRSATISILNMIEQPDLLVGGMLSLSALIGAASAVIGFFVALRNAQAVSFTDQTIIELAKVTWPDREETVNSSMVVIIATLIMASSLAFFDLFWARITNLFLFTEG